MKGYAGCHRTPSLEGQIKLLWEQQIVKYYWIILDFIEWKNMGCILTVCKAV